MRDITLGDTFKHHFTTRQFSDGVPTVLAGSPVISVHEEANDTFITAGITLDVSIGASPVIGLNEVSIIAIGGNGYEVGKSYCIFISAGTVGGVSVVGEVIGEFTVQLSAAAINLDNGTDGLTALATDIAGVSTDVADVPTVSEFNARTIVAANYALEASIGTLSTDVADVPTVSEFNARTILTADYYDPAVDTVIVSVIQVDTITALSIEANAIGASELAASAANKIRDAILDEATASHVSAGTVGLTLDNLPNDGALTNLDAAITTRATPAQVATELGTYDGPTNAQLNARTILAASYFDPAADTVANVTLVATTTTNTDMVGTDSAALASVCTEVRLAELAAANLPTDIANVQSDTDDIQTRLPASLTGGRMSSNVDGIAPLIISSAAFAVDAVPDTALSASAIDKIRDGILPTQNVAFSNLMFLFVAASDHVTPVTGATGTAVTRSIDGSAFGAGTGTLAEVSNGMYQYDASAADMNGGIITFRFTGSGGTPGAPDDRFITIVTGGGV